jgi:hypothetical protein
MTNVIEPNSWDYDTLLAKAQLYLEQMNSTVADDWKYGLWSALTLELLCRAALAHLSPALLADTKNWRNIMHALGRAPTTKKFTPTSIGTKEVLARLGELLPDFNSEVVGFCGRHSERRNAELHSGEIVFTGIGTAEWLPRFYRACKILLDSMDKPFEDFVCDPERALELIASLDDAAARAVEQDIRAHTTTWSHKLEEENKDAVFQATAWATRHAGHRVSCPACHSPAILHGTPSGSVSTTVGDDEVIQRQTMLPSAFECIACGLKITSYSKLSACGLGDAFSSTTTYTAAEFFDLHTEDELEDARNELVNYEPDFNEY